MTSSSSPSSPPPFHHTYTCDIFTLHFVFVRYFPPNDTAVIVEFNDIYVVTWTRCTTYFMGMFLGYLFHETKANVKMPKVRGNLLVINEQQDPSYPIYSIYVQIVLYSRTIMTENGVHAFTCVFCSHMTGIGGSWLVCRYRHLHQCQLCSVYDFLRRRCRLRRMDGSRHSYLGDMFEVFRFFGKSKQNNGILGSLS